MYFLTVPSSFSLFSRIFKKSWEQIQINQLNQDNLIELMMLASENDVLQIINNETVVEEFCQTKASEKSSL